MISKDLKSKHLRRIKKLSVRYLQNENGKKFYPSRAAYEQDFVYMIIDPIKRHVIILANFYEGPSFFE